MPTEKLTNTFINNIETPKKTTDYFDKGVKGLILRISPTGSISYRLKYYINRKANIYTIGKHGSITITQAKKEAQRLNGLISQGIDVQKEKNNSTSPAIITIKEFLDYFYIDWYKKHNKDINGFLSLIKGKVFKDIINLNLEYVNNKTFVTSYLNKYQINNNISNGRYNRILSTIKGMFSRAHEYGYIKENSVKNVKKLKVLESKVRYFTKIETKSFFKVLEKLQSSNAKNIIKIAYYTGMRKGEILSLDWQDIDFETNQFVLNASKTKTSKSRSIPIHNEVKKILSEMVIKDKGLVFLSNITNKKYNDVKYSWNKLLKEAQIENFRFHDLRHNFCSMLVMKGVPIYTVAQLAGHADVKTTQRYAHLSPDVKKSAIDLL